LIAACSIFVIGESLPMRAEWPPSPVMVTAMVKYTLGTPDLFFYSPGLLSKVRLRNGEAVEDRGGGGLVAFAANLFRRMYGPFVWILPSKWNFRALQSAEFFLYPGTLLWYALIPFILVGIGVAGWRIATRREVEFAIVFLWLFTAMYFFQYLLINLSYRQRDVMQPLLLVFAFIGLTAARSLQHWPRWYAGYWILLAVIAGTHLGVRAFLRL
jgi:hypothetical protein